MQDIEVTVPHVELMLAALEGLIDALGELYGDIDPAPVPGSPASRELSDADFGDFVDAAIAQATVLAEAAADHAMAFARTLHEPVQTIAPWACTRSALEAAALSCWLFDPGIGVRERCGRSLAFRFQGMIQEQKYARAKGDSSAVNKASKNISELDAQARGVGFVSLRDKKDRRIGIGQIMPSTTNLIASVLGEEQAYRLLSSVAHAHVPALAQVGFRRVDTGGRLLLEKSLNPVFAAYLCQKCMEATARPSWLRCCMYGWSEPALAGALNSAYDSLPAHLMPARFWATAASGSPAN